MPSFHRIDFTSVNLNLQLLVSILFSAAVLKLSKKKMFRHQDKIVLIITGSGLKAMEAIEPSEIKIQHASLLSLESTLDKLL